MSTRGSRFSSYQAALAVAEMYENVLNARLQLARVENDAAYAEKLQAHLEEAKRFHESLRKPTIGAEEWHDFCTTELNLAKRTMEECIESIESLLPT